jgi:hypothetical protein
MRDVSCVVRLLVSVVVCLAAVGRGRQEKAAYHNDRGVDHPEHGDYDEAIAELLDRALTATKDRVALNDFPRPKTAFVCLRL